MFPAGFFAAGHGVGADEDCAGGAGVGGGGGADGAFDAADVGDDATVRQVRGEAGVELDDFIHRGGEHDEVGAGDGVFGGVGHVVEPGLVFEGGADFGAAGPDGDVFGLATGAGGAGDGGAEQAGGENGEVLDHGRKEWQGERGGGLVEPRREAGGVLGGNRK